MKKIRLFGEFSLKSNLILFCVILITIVSIKPIFFCYNLVLTKYFQNVSNSDILKHNDYLKKALKSNPNSVQYFDHSSLVKNAIAMNDKNLLKTIPPRSAEILLKIYNNDFYLRYFLGKINQFSNWDCITSFNLENFAKKKLNTLTISLLKKLDYNLPEETLPYVIDYLYWHKNGELAGFFIDFFKVDVKGLFTYPDPPGYLESLGVLHKLTQSHLGEVLNQGEKNLIISTSPDFQSTILSKRRIGGFKVDRGFFLQWGQANINNNTTSKNMCFNLEPGKPARDVKITFTRKKYSHQSGMYLLSFDYLSHSRQSNLHFRTGEAKKSFKKIQATKGRWFKAIALVDSKSLGEELLKIQFLYRSNGIILIDNLCLLKLNNTEGIGFETGYFYTVDFESFVGLQREVI